MARASAAKGNYFDPSWTEKLTLPVRRVGERWEFFYGGDVPVAQGSFGELTISAAALADEKFRQTVSKQMRVKILDEGATLVAALSDRQCSDADRRWPWDRMHDVPIGTTRFVPVSIGPLIPRSKRQDEADTTLPRRDAGLWLRLRGLSRCELECSSVNMPAGFDPGTATSLNHAFTLLSTRYETHRISHTGNVYAHFFYQDKDGRWYPLDDLRCGVQAQGERALIGEVWRQVEAVMGWRPVSEPRRVGKAR